MAVLSLLLNRPKLARFEFPLTGVMIINFDVCKQVTHEMDAEITKSPVEDGSEIADHVALKNKRASFDIVISDTPLNTITGALGGLATSVIADKIRKSGALALGLSRISSLVLEKTFTRAQDAFKLLEELRDRKTLISAILGFKKYENAVVTNLRVTQDLTTTGSLNASMTIEELKLVTTQTTRIPQEAVDKSVETTATSEVNAGKQAVKKVSEETQSRLASILSNILGIGK